MNMRLMLVWILAGVTFLTYSACESPTDTGGEPQLSTITGIVQRSDVTTPVPNVIVEDLNDASATDTTDATGRYALQYQLTEAHTARLVARRTGFGNDTADVVLEPGRTQSINLTIVADTSSPPTGPSTGKAANIVLISSTDEIISIRGTGGNETATMVFEVRDSLGVPVSASNSVEVFFSIQGGPGAGEYVFPTSGFTDRLTGRVLTKVTSGNGAGVVQVYATATVDTTIIRSRPVRILIAGGFPSSSRFSMSVEKVNIPAIFDNITDNISVAVADNDGNPVKGAAVYFSTTSGDIEAGGVTDNTGRITSVLRTSGTRPASGIATVSAQTVGDGGVTISRSAQIIFSLGTQISGPTSLFVVRDSGSYVYNFTVQDVNGHPLSANSSVVASLSGQGSGDVVLDGDVSTIIPDTQDPAYTTYSVVLKDTKRGGSSGPVRLTITVTSDNGNKPFSVDGAVLDETSSVPIGLPSSGDAYSLASLVSGTQQVSIAGIGKLSTLPIKFAALDSIGRRISENKKIYVSFNVVRTSGLPGGETVFPPGDSTNAAGEVSTTFNAGISAGVIQIIASAVVNGRTLIATQMVNISGGFPDQLHFTLGAQRYNFPGLDRNAITDGITVQMGDKFTNPAQPSPVRFSTSNGIIQTQGISDANGFLTVQLYSAEPRPEGVNVLPGLTNGFARVYAQTIGEDSTEIRDSLLILWTGTPILAKTSGPATVTILNGGSAGPWTFTVQDQYGHPMSLGTSITVGGAGLLVTGNANITMPDLIVGGAGITDFTVNVQDVDPGSISAPPTSFTLLVTVSHPVYGTYTLILADGTVE